MNTEPDGFLGAVLATAGIKGIETLINGPGGCRSRTQILLKELLRDYAYEDPRCGSSKYFSRQSKLPCTYLNSNDMIMGSFDKISDGITSVVSITNSDLTVVDTLGASLQVTDNRGSMSGSDASKNVIMTNRYLSSMSLYDGFDDTTVRIIEHFYESQIENSDDGNDNKIPNSVNILGYNISDSGWEFGKKEIENLLRLMGVEVLSFVGCHCTKDEIRNSSRAELNVLVHPEFSIKTAEFYFKKFNIPYLVPGSGSPVGYPSLISFVNEISKKLGVDPTPAHEQIFSEKANVDRILMNSEKFAGSLRGCSCSLKGIPSDVLPIVKWMYDHFSVVPGHISVSGGFETPAGTHLMNYIREIDCADALETDSFDDCSIIFTDGFTAEFLKDKDPSKSYVQINFPYSFGTSFINRSTVGTYGCRYIIDEIFNGCRRFHCGQPTMVDFR